MAIMAQPTMMARRSMAMANTKPSPSTTSHGISLQSPSRSMSQASPSCYIKRLISMYQYRSDGSADDAYLDINVAEVMERIRYEQRIGAIQKAFYTMREEARAA